MQDAGQGPLVAAYQSRSRLKKCSSLSRPVCLWKAFQVKQQGLPPHCLPTVCPLCFINTPCRTQVRGRWEQPTDRALTLRRASWQSAAPCPTPPFPPLAPPQDAGHGLLGDAFGDCSSALHAHAQFHPLSLSPPSPCRMRVRGRWERPTDHAPTLRKTLYFHTQSLTPAADPCAPSVASTPLAGRRSGATGSSLRITLSP